MSRFSPKSVLPHDLQPGAYQHGYSTSTAGYTFISQPGLNRSLVEAISAQKSEPSWMLQKRLKAHGLYESLPTPTWGGDLSAIAYDSIHYYLKPTDSEKKSWADVPPDIKTTFDKLGIPEAERGVLAGVKAQFDSEVIYGSIKKLLVKQGVIFISMDEALKKHESLVKEYFGTLIPPGDNKFAALNSAVWSGGSFVYVPPGVEVKLPLQAYFRLNSPLAGQFERTLIIASEGSKVHYIEGCTAPAFSSESLHSAVVEIFVGRGARVQYTTVQNWYKTVYNLVTKRARVDEEGEMVWTDFNMGCLTSSSRVFIKSKGALSISQVKAGDYIYSVDINTQQPILAKVLASQKTGTKPVFRLKTENSRLIEATENHPFLVMSSSSQKKGYSQLLWQPLKNIQLGDRIAIIRGLPDEGKSRILKFHYEKQGPAKYTKYQPSIPTLTTSNLMWLLGVYLGDGYCEKNKQGIFDRVYFAVPPDDRARARLETVVKEIFNIPYKNKGICLTLPSVIVGEFIKYLEFTGSAKTKRIPSWVFSLPRQQKLAFIQGYLDSDGSVLHQKEKRGILYGQIIFASVNKFLLDDMKLLMISAGLNPLKIATYSKFRRLVLGKEYKYYTCHFLSLNIRGNLERILGKKDQDCYLEFVRVTEIEKIPDQEVYDLEIDGSHNFIANGIVVHNSKLTMKYPGYILAGKGARGETLSLALAGAGQHQDTGSKAVHLAPYTTSTIISKSISKSGGRTSYRGLVNIGPKAHGSKSRVVCDALLLDPKSRSDTYPTNRIYNHDVTLEHEASVSKIGEDQLFYLMSRGLPEDEAAKLIVSGFVAPLIKKLPLEYAVEMNRLIDMEMQGSIG